MTDGHPELVPMLPLQQKSNNEKRLAIILKHFHSLKSMLCLQMLRAKFQNSRCLAN